eukprot:TRINITY_DN6695_c0_g1_i1.p1 TRINITY_DN6695_c0_g1~~TRINITY_DN6695_c0_g1_i1.p1  ORF type:complete len:289 (-),score=74.66 TRINITY_DN6695_c0_g1_i1:106-909(-)
MEDNATTTTTTDPCSVINRFMGKNSVEGKLVFGMITGSQAYNVSTASSDFDYFGIYQAPTHRILSLKDPPPSSSTLPTEQKPDVTVHEVATFANLLIKGNPFVLEMLFNDRPELCWWDMNSKFGFHWLKERRMSFVTQTAIREHLSYIEKRLREKGKNRFIGKRIYHVVRLLFELQRMIQGSRPLVWVPEGEERNILVDIREERYGNENLENLISTLMTKIKSQDPWINLPLEADKNLVEEWLVGIRWEQLIIDEVKKGSSAANKTV